jgi:hypothetical protein
VNYAPASANADRPVQLRDPTVADVTVDYAEAGFTPAEILAATVELRRVYALDDRNPTESLELLRAMIEPVVDESRPTDPGVEDYHCDEGITL